MPATPDYSTLIDAETWAFIRETERWYPPEAAGFPIARQREVYDAMARAFDAPRPPGVTARDDAIGGVRCRIYEAAGGAGPATVVYYHGGGFVVGGLESHDAVCAEICAGTGLRVVAADYRLSPEHLHPAAFEDALAVARALAASGPLVLAGDSAGGNLAAAVAHATRGEGLAIRGQVLIYPGLGGRPDAGSYMAHAGAPMLTRADVLFYAGIRHPGGIAPAAPDPTLRPLDDTDYAGLPPTLLFPAECDPLCDDALTYARRIGAAGGRVRCHVDKGLVHAHLRARHSVGRARDSFARIVAGIGMLAQGRWRDGDE